MNALTPTPQAEGKLRSEISKSISPEHKRMARVFAMCLTLNDFDARNAFTLLAKVHLSSGKRAAIAYAMLNSLELDQAVDVSATVIDPAGTPLPPWLGGMSDARDWAERATRDQHRSYGLACCEAMSHRDLSGMFAHLKQEGRLI